MTADALRDNIKPGKPVDLVRWFLTPEGWKTELVRITYLGHDEATITGVDEARHRGFTASRDVWDWAIA